jgi:hypothetical protein
VSISSTGELTVKPAAATGNITIKATSTVAGYTNISETKVVTINAPSPDYDFTEEADANLLGLYPGSTGYIDGAAVISAMDLRTDNTIFYDPQLPVNPSYIYGITGVLSDDIAEANPVMAWIFDGNDLIVYGWSDIPISIVFNVAVIKPDGTGWLKGDGSTYFEEYTSARSGKISILDLTNGAITTVAGLSGCKMYVIVRSTSPLSVAGDFNTNPGYNIGNVISVTF